MIRALNPEVDGQLADAAEVDHEIDYLGDDGVIGAGSARAKLALCILKRQRRLTAAQAFAMLQKTFAIVQKMFAMLQQTSAVFQPTPLAMQPSKLNFLTPKLNFSASNLKIQHKFVEFYQKSRDSGA